MQKPIDALLVGCGPRGTVHAGALAAVDGFALRALCDLDAERLAAVGENVGIAEQYVDLEDALAAVEPAHVTIATPPTARLPLVETAVDHGVESVVVEKPMANSYREVRRMREVADAADVHLAVGFQTLWAEEIRAIKDWIDDGSLGEVSRLVGTTKGGLGAQGCHFLHMLDWLLDGTPETVRAFADGPAGLDPGMNPWIHDHVEPETTVLELTYPGDRRVFCHFGATAPDEPAQAGSFWLEYRLDVIGTHGVARFVHGDHAHALFEDGTTEHVDARAFDEDGYMTAGYYDRLARALVDPDLEHPSRSAAATAAHRTMDAAMRSAERRRAIDGRIEPPSFGPDTTDRLRQRLQARTPVTVSTLMYESVDRETALASLADLGVESIDLWSVPMFADHLDPQEDPDTVRGALEEHGLACPVVSIYDADPVEARLEAAAAVGADTVVMGGRTPDRPETWDPDRLAPWLDRAAELELTIAFENHLDTLETVDEMESLLDALDHEAAGICLAPTHLYLAGEDLETAITRLGTDVSVLYLWDMEPGAGRADADEVWWNRADSQVPGGGGAIDFRRSLALAVEHLPAIPWVMCWHGSEDWQRSRIDQAVARGIRHVEGRRP